MKRVRLMNVHRVHVMHALPEGMSIAHEYNASCVELSPLEGGLGGFVLVMYSVDQSGGLVIATPDRVRLVGRLKVPGLCAIVDPLDPNPPVQIEGQDLITWAVAGSNTLVNIHPFADEHIWIDPSFSDEYLDGAGNIRVPEQLQKLYEQKTACHASLIVNERILRQLAGGPERKVQSKIVLQIRSVLAGIERRINSTRKETIGGPSGRTEQRGS